jgi:hypothetical protein
MSSTEWPSTLHTDHCVFIYNIYICMPAPTCGPLLARPCLASCVYGHGVCAFQFHRRRFAWCATSGPANFFHRSSAARWMHALARYIYIVHKIPRYLCIIASLMSHDQQLSIPSTQQTNIKPDRQLEVLCYDASTVISLSS